MPCHAIPDRIACFALFYFEVYSYIRVLFIFSFSISRHKNFGMEACYCMDDPIQNEFRWNYATFLYLITYFLTYNRTCRRCIYVNISHCIRRWNLFYWMRLFFVFSFMSYITVGSYARTRKELVSFQLKWIQTENLFGASETHSPLFFKVLDWVDLWMSDYVAFWWEKKDMLVQTNMKTFKLNYISFVASGSLLHNIHPNHIDTDLLDEATYIHEWRYSRQYKN